MEKLDDLYDCEPETRTVLVVINVLVSHSSVVSECWDGDSMVSDWEFVEPQSFSPKSARLV